MEPKMSLLTKPKAPLSAYNLFFQCERKRILDAIDSKQTNTKPFTVQDILHVRMENKTKPRKRRQHRKTHGKIGFCELARKVAKRWGQLDQETRDLFEDQAQSEKQECARLYNAWQAQQFALEQQQQKNQQQNIYDLSTASHCGAAGGHPEPPSCEGTNPHSRPSSFRLTAEGDHAGPARNHHYAPYYGSSNSNSENWSSGHNIADSSSLAAAPSSIQLLHDLQQQIEVEIARRSSPGAEEQQQRGGHSNAVVTHEGTMLGGGVDQQHSYRNSNHHHHQRDPVAITRGEGRPSFIRPSFDREGIATMIAANHHRMMYQEPAVGQSSSMTIPTLLLHQQQEEDNNNNGVENNRPVWWSYPAASSAGYQSSYYGRRHYYHHQQQTPALGCQDAIDRLLAEW